MSAHFLASIEDLKNDLRTLEDKVIKTKQLINMLAERAGVAPPYADAELTSQPQAAGATSDEFYNKPLFRCAKAFLARRKSHGAGPATAEEIYAGLLAGGYEKFPSSKDDAMGGLRISLGKSSHTFAKLPNGSYGLTEWYGIKKRATKAGAPADAKEEDPKDDADAETEEEDYFKVDEPTESEAGNANSK